MIDAMERALSDVVGENLRRLRRERKVSLADLAEASSVSRATLASLEAGKGNPTLGTLNALCASLGVPLGAVLENPEDDAVVVVSAAERGFEDGIRCILQLPRPGYVELNEFELTAGKTYPGNIRPSGTFEHFILIDGTVEVTIDDQTIDLQRGDYLRFPADRTHAYRAAGDAARALLVMDYSA
jgi:transcriptional regulator with XRE-family HTH domain